MKYSFREINTFVDMLQLNLSVMPQIFCGINALYRPDVQRNPSRSRCLTSLVRNPEHRKSRVRSFGRYEMGHSSRRIRARPVRFNVPRRCQSQSLPSMGTGAHINFNALTLQISNADSCVGGHQIVPSGVRLCVL